MKKKLYSHVFMAFGKMRETREFQRDFFTGVGAVNILAVNPDRKQQNEILKSDATLDPINYVDTTTVKDSKGNDVEVPRTRVTFIVRTDPKIACNNGIEMTQFVSFFISKGYLYSHKDGVTKVQVIDRFGRTAWVTSEELKEHKIPVLTIKKGERAGQTMLANLDKDYRPAYIGEPDLIENIRVFMNFPRPDVWDNEKRTYVMKTNEAELVDSDCSLSVEQFDQMFKGDFSCLKEPLESEAAKMNAYKLMFGVRTKNDGTLQQAVYTRKPIPLAVMNYKELDAALVSDAAANPPRHQDTFYKAGPLEKYSATPTDYSQVAASEAPASEEVVDDLPPDTSPFTENAF